MSCALCALWGLTNEVDANSRSKQMPGTFYILLPRVASVPLYSPLAGTTEANGQQTSETNPVDQDFPYTSVDGALYVVPPKSTKKETYMHQTQSMSEPLLTRQLCRRRPGNNRRKIKPTKVDGILYVEGQRHTSKDND
ncbi:hypothetical protein THAOC_13920 [Thalassiosira oceanica]|uniref:Uncharacterized protein n=1 Tax=Thalassiosira oceanica TaxID=159749 RepID=K0SJX5_THAOC|nr:hypothetical protein THAOC_13920 [Thalassiosira oceanica]|eukprot:EJK65244.1 hypothetical protein THAOC_13920 [Thalassiosira oceanica]